MNYTFYRLDCLTNLHMGGSDANYDVIDLQVERDPVLGEPTMNASGVKGALRDHCEIIKGCHDKANWDRNDDIKEIFGTRDGGTQQGSYAFFGADLLARPVRASGCDTAWILATTPDLIASFVKKLESLDIKMPKINIPTGIEGDAVKVSCDCAKVEGYNAEKVPVDAGMEWLLGTDRYAVMSSDMLRSIALPVVAHNVLENGQSRNLWYEEYVPHKSVFGLIVGRPNEDDKFAEILEKSPVVQFGAEASTGCGYVKMTQVIPEKQEAKSDEKA